MDSREKNDRSVMDGHAVEKKVFSYMEELCMLAPGDKVVLGVSGGADSVCLFLLLWEYAKTVPLSLSVVHVNHGIRAEAAEDARYVEGLCRERGIPFSLVEANVREVASREGCSEEDAGRRVRYEAFEQAAKRLGGAKIAVAHNSNDNAETMLFHLFRGSGLAGLSGIAPVRGDIIRPILCLERREVEAYLKGLSVKWCQDSTNEKDDYRRNRIRHHILPYAEAEVVSGAVEHMGRTAGLLRETEEYLERQTQDALRRCVGEVFRENSAAGSVGLYLPAHSFAASPAAPQRCSPDVREDGQMFSGESIDRGNEACQKRVDEKVQMRREKENLQGDGNVFCGGMIGAVDAERGISGFRIEIADFLRQHTVLQKRMLLHLLKQLSLTGKDISWIHVTDTLALFEREGNGSVNLPFGIRAWRQYGSVFLGRGEAMYPMPGKGAAGQGKNKPAWQDARVLEEIRLSECRRFAADRAIVIPLTDELFHTSLVYTLGDWGKIEFMGFFIKKGREVPRKQYTKWFDYDKIKECVEIRPRRQGDYLMIEDREGALRHKTLKDYMVAEKIPRQVRDAIPLMAEGSHVLWLPGRRISAAAKIDGNTERILQVRLLGAGFNETDETEEKNGGEH